MEKADTQVAKLELDSALKSSSCDIENILKVQILQQCSRPSGMKQSL